VSTRRPWNPTRPARPAARACLTATPSANASTLLSVTRSPAASDIAIALAPAAAAARRWPASLARGPRPASLRLHVGIYTTHTSHATLAFGQIHGAPEGSTPMTLTPGCSALTYAAMPATRPPPPTATNTACRLPRCALESWRRRAHPQSETHRLRSVLLTFHGLEQSRVSFDQSTYRECPEA